MAEETVSQAQIKQMIRDAATARGIDPALALRIAEKESNFKPDAIPPLWKSGPKKGLPMSSAYGVFQITDDTWKDNGGDPAKRKDLNENIRVGLNVFEKNKRKFLKDFKREPRPEELYTMHIFGASGGPKLLRSDPSTPLADLFSKTVLRSNPSFGKMNVGEFIATMQKKMGPIGAPFSKPKAFKEQRSGTVPMPAAPRDVMKPQPSPVVPITETTDRIPPVRERMPMLAGEGTEEPQAMLSKDVLEKMGPNYQAALAAMALADTREDDEDDEDSLASQYREQQAAKQSDDIFEMPQRFAGLELGYQSPFFEEQQQPLRMANGGFVEPFGVPDSGPITADTRKALTTGQGFSAAEMMRMLGKVGKEAASNFESLVRGRVASVPGVVGDIESIFRDDKKRKFATTKEVGQQYLPPFITPTKEAEGFFELGTYGLDPTVVALKATNPIAKAAAPTAAEMMMRMAPAAKPMYMAEDAAKQTISPVGFTSRLEDFISQQKGPVTKQQFLGTLRGKFRDYDIARVEKALSDFEGQKLKPDVILDRLETTFPVKTLQRNITEPGTHPKQGVLRLDFDNKYQDRPMGVLTLNLPTSEKMISSQDRAIALLRGLRELRGGSVSRNPALMDMLDEFAYETGGVQARHQIQKAMDAGRKLEKIYETSDKYEKIYTNPSGVSGDLWKKTFEKEMERRGLDPAKKLDPKTTRELINLSNEAVWKKADVELERMNIVPPARTLLGDDIASGIDEEEFKAGVSQIARQFNTQAKYQQSELLQSVSPVFQQKLDEFVKKSTIYKGGHPAMTQQGNQPVAISRFTDHTVTLPDLGKVKLMHVNELQSDLYNDIWKQGSISGSQLKDHARATDLSKEGYALALKEGGTKGQELFYDLVNYKKDFKYQTDLENENAIKKIIERHGEDNPLFPTLMPTADKIAKLLDRARVGTYDLPEAFANMENSPQVVQQLIIKNVVGSAIDRGVNAITFPGSESLQPQLYEKLPNNLKQVIKDLGPGFDMRQITLTNKDGESFSHWGLVWGKEAADRLKSKGIPFKKGGLVEKLDYDNRKYI
jgi:hypothetical protein